MNKFDPYDVLGVVVPGTLFLGLVSTFFPEMNATLGSSPFPAAFDVILFTSLAVFIGQVVQAVASILEPVIYFTWGGKPSDRALNGDIGRYLPSESAARIKEKLSCHVGGTLSNGSLFLVAIQMSEGQNRGRAGRFNSLYGYQRALLLLAFIGTLLLGASMLWGAASEWSCWSKAVAAATGFILIGLSWYRAWHCACYYVREVLLTAEQSLDNGN